jgi:hypothetical protein
MAHVTDNIQQAIERNGFLDESINAALINSRHVSTVMMALKGRLFVYVLCNGNNVIYVGCSRNIYTRLVAHKSAKRFDHVLLIEFKGLNAWEKELELIKLLQPEMNLYSK